MSPKDNAILRAIRDLADVEYVATSYGEALDITRQVRAQLADLIGAEE